MFISVYKLNAAGAADSADVVLHDGDVVCANCLHSMEEQEDETLLDGLDAPVIYFCSTCD